MSCERVRVKLLCTVMMMLLVSHSSIAQAVAASEPTQPAPEPQFDALELRVIGNTRLPNRDIETALYPFLGEYKTIKDVEAARVALETLYHERGYQTVYVDILPDQTIDDGVIRLKVTEAMLRSVRVTGAHYFSGRQIKAALPAAQVGTVPSIPELQAQLAQVNAQSGDRVVVPVLKAGTIPGTVDLSLKVEDHLPLHASLELNNQYTYSTEPLRAIAAVSYDNLFGRFDSLGVQYQTAPQDLAQVDSWVTNYSTHLFDSSTRLAFYYFKSNSEVATLATADNSVTVLGTGEVSGVRLIQPITGAANSLHTVTFGIDYKHFIDDIRVRSLLSSGDAGNSGNSGLATPISYSNFSLAYSGGWRAEKTQWTFGASANFGVRGWQNSSAEFENKRYQGQPNYFYLRSDGRIRIALPAKLNVQLNYAGQYTVEPIISNEQFSIAGADGVRGYLEAEALADRGVKGGVQLGAPQLALFKSALTLDGFAFFDSGSVSVLKPLPGESTGTSLQSWGIGIDLAALDHFTGSLIWAYPLRDASHTQRGDSRVLFDVRTSW